jgi:hypothetical protein
MFKYDIGTQVEWDVQVMKRWTTRRGRVIAHVQGGESIHEHLTRLGLYPRPLRVMPMKDISRFDRYLISVKEGDGETYYARDRQKFDGSSRTFGRLAGAART